MRKQQIAVLASAVLLISGALVTPVTAHGRQKERAPVVMEFNEDGTSSSHEPVVGKSTLTRSEHGLSAKVDVRRLRPRGVYTFWWVVPQGAGVFPDDVFVAHGASAIASRNGRAHVEMWARAGAPGIEGFPVLGGASFGSLVDPEGATVRVEIAYHGQARDAGDDLHSWMFDFWTGAACPPATPNPNPAQPHCPVYYAATHTP